MVLCIGFNDVWRQFDLPTIPESGVSPEEYRANLNKMADATKAKMIWMTPYYLEPNKEDAMRKRMDVALTFDADGCLTEAAIANVAVVDAKGALVLPEFKNALVGTVATKAMELAKAFMPVEIRPIPQAELDSVREMMILGTAHECIGVTHFEGRPIGDGKTGPVAHKLRKLIREDLLAGGEAF